MKSSTLISAHIWILMIKAKLWMKMTNFSSALVNYLLKLIWLNKNSSTSTTFTVLWERRVFAGLSLLIRESETTFVLLMLMTTKELIEWRLLRPMPRLLFVKLISRRPMIYLWLFNRMTLFLSILLTWSKLINITTDKSKSYSNSRKSLNI